MALIGHHVEGVEHASLEALRAVRRHSSTARDAVSSLEPDPEHLARQAVGFVAHNGDRFTTVRLVDAHRKARRDIVSLQEQHDLFDLLLLRPRLRDLPRADTTDAGDLRQTTGLLVDDRQRLQTEMVDDAVCGDRSYALYETRPQVLADALHSCGKLLGIVLDDELLAVLRVALPAPPQLHRCTDVQARHAPDDRDRVVASSRHQLRYSVPVLLVVICNPLQRSLEHASRRAVLERTGVMLTAHADSRWTSMIANSGRAPTRNGRCELPTPRETYIWCCPLR